MKTLSGVLAIFLLACGGDDAQAPASAMPAWSPEKTPTPETAV